MSKYVGIDVAKHHLDCSLGASASACLTTRRA